MTTYDVIVVGGGLAGLMAARRLQGRVRRVGLVNAPIPGTPHELGGFARFSGAKFSLFPAGSGLVPIARGERALQAAYRAVLDVFAESQIEQFCEHSVNGEERAVEDTLRFRQYHSILLTPGEMRTLLEHLRESLSQVDLLQGSVVSIQTASTNPSLTLQDGTRLEANTLVLAAGRLGADLLLAAGIPETNGKGLDIGVRVEFESRTPLEGLRAHGPDAKFLSGMVRTFCLNSPGTVFHYPAFGVQVPGGIVADPAEQRSNVGILRRLPDKRQARIGLLRRISALSSPVPPLFAEATGDQVCADSQLRSVLSHDVAEEVTAFAQRVGTAGLIDWPAAYKVHFPLIDWHWPVFSQQNAFRTEIPGIYAVGDLSGHARGLLQAATSGWLCVDEFAP